MCIGGSCYYTRNRYGSIDIDDRDREIIAGYEKTFNERIGPRTGDFVRFADGICRRISYVWADENDNVLSVQTSDGGSFHLGNGYVSMSGSLYTGVGPDTLTRRESANDPEYGTQWGDVWIFHHNDSGAGHAADTSIKFRVFDCSVNAPTH